MELTICQHTSVKDLQDQFSYYFPFLQIEFYRSAASRKKSVLKQEKVAGDERVKQLMKPYNPCKVKIDRETTVSELEKMFRSNGLNVHVYRKFGTFWIQTSLTNDWTLHRQNDEALLLNMPVEQPQQKAQNQDKPGR